MQNRFEKEVLFNEDILNLVDGARDRYIPVMLNKTARVLFENVEMLKPKNILEIGTAIGYSAIVMLKANSESRLTTIEFNDERFNEAEQNFIKFNINNRVNAICKDGYEALIDLEKEDKKFDFVFLDGPKGQYLKYFKVIENLITEDAVVVVDDVLFNYFVDKEQKVCHKRRAMVKKLREFVENMLTNNKYDVKIINVDEGIMIIRKK